MADNISGIRHVPPAYPVKPVPRPAREQDTNKRRKPPQPKEPDDDEDDDKPVIDEHMSPVLGSCRRLLGDAGRRTAAIGGPQR